MTRNFPVLWASDDAPPHVGRIEVGGEQLVLRAANGSLAFSQSSVVASAIERAPARRLRGLPVLRFALTGGESVSVAALGGIGTLHEIAKAVATPLPERRSA